VKISIITISYNAAKTIERTLLSVAEQSYKDIEHIIIDGGSTDDTLAICNKFPHLSKTISEPDKGVYDAFNKGIQLATGNIVGFLNSDDTFFNVESVNHIVSNFDSDTECVFGDLHYVNTDGRIIRKWKSRPFITGNFKKHMPAHPTFYCRRETYNRLGGYDISYKIAGDFELMLRFLEKNQIQSKYIPINLVKMLPGGISNAGIKSKITITKEEFRAFQQNKISVNKLLYIFHKAQKIKEFF
jgi:glycosyltransferase involved in cell wall biosynthesis